MTNCVLCNKALTTTQVRKHREYPVLYKTFCSKAHEFEYRRANAKPKPAKQPAIKACTLCSSTFSAKQKTQKLCSDECRREQARLDGRKGGKHYTSRPKATKQCILCIASFTCFASNVERSKYCSLQCARKDSKARRKLIIRKQYVEPVSITYLRQRDHDTCKLCNEPVSNEPVPHRLAATIDHIKPISKGGKHKRSNCQLAHFICNSLKGNRKAGNAQTVRHTG